MEHEEAIDALLMIRYQRGDRDAFAELVDRHSERVFNYTLRRVGRASLAEALTERVFLRVVKNAGDFKHEGRFTTWLYRIVFEACQAPEQAPARAPALEEPKETAIEIDTQDFAADASSQSEPATDVPRAAKSATRAVESATASAATDAVATVKTEDLTTTIRTTIETLPALTRDVFLLRHIAGLPPSEIADVVGTDETSMYQELRQALDRLQETLVGFEEYTRALR